MIADEFKSLCLSVVMKHKHLWPSSWRMPARKDVTGTWIYAAWGAEDLMIADLWVKYRKTAVRHPGAWAWSEVTGELRRLSREERNGGLTGRKDGSNRAPKSWDAPSSPEEVPGFDKGMVEPEVSRTSYGGPQWTERHTQLQTVRYSYGERFELLERHRTGGNKAQHQWSSTLKYPWSKQARKLGVKDRSPGGDWSYKGNHPKLRAAVEKVYARELTLQHTGKAVYWGPDNAPPRFWETGLKFGAVADWRSLPSRRVKHRGGAWYSPTKWELARDKGLWADPKASRPIQWVRASVWRPQPGDHKRVTYHWLNEPLQPSYCALRDKWTRTCREEFRAWQQWVAAEDARLWRLKVEADDVRWRGYDSPTARE